MRARQRPNVVTAEGNIEPDMGHVLVVYDARSPECQAGGEADVQWETAVAACLVPGLLRRIRWQRLIAFLGTAPELCMAYRGTRGELMPD